MSYTPNKEVAGSFEASVTSYQTVQLNPKSAYLLLWLPQISLSVYISPSRNE